MFFIHIHMEILLCITESKLPSYWASWFYWVCSQITARIYQLENTRASITSSKIHIFWFAVKIVGFRQYESLIYTLFHYHILSQVWTFYWDLCLVEITPHWVKPTADMLGKSRLSKYRPWKAENSWHTQKQVKFTYTQNMLSSVIHSMFYISQ